MDGLAVARMMLKLAAARGIARPVGKVIRGVGELGAGLAEGLGAGAGGQTAGRLAALGGAGAVGYGGARKAKRKIDEFRYRHGLYREPTY